MGGILDPSSSTSRHGRRRAGSKHRRGRGLPPPGTAAFRLGLPLAVLVLLGVLVAVAWTLGGAHRGPLPPPLTLAAVLATMSLVFAVAWRGGLSPLSALLAAALSAAYPPAALAARVGVPEHLAVAALLAAVLLILARTHRRMTVPLAALVAGVAAALSPLALTAAPFLVWQSGGTMGRRYPAPTLPLAGAVYFATVGLGWAVLGVDAGVEPVAGAALLLAWANGPIAVAVSAGALLFGILSAPLRPVAGYVLALLTLSVWPDGNDVVRYTVLIAPALALLTAAAAERALVTLLRFSPVRARLSKAVGARSR